MSRTLPTLTGTMTKCTIGPDMPGGDVPSPTLVAAWLALDVLPAERIPRWAAFWLVDGHDGPALVELAGLHGDEPREVRDLLPSALAECRVSVPAADAAAAMEAFTHLAQLCVDGKAGERWIVDKVAEILSRSGYANEVIALPLGQLYDLDDEWGAGRGRTDAELRAVTRQACHDQLRLSPTHSRRPGTPPQAREIGQSQTAVRTLVRATPPTHPGPMSRYGPGFAALRTKRLIG
jgi:hypothetical protein